MARHRDGTKRGHEDAVISAFLSFFNNQSQVAYAVVDNPNPPDAICSDEGAGKSIWIEQADIYRSGDEAREDTSFSNPHRENYTHKEDTILQPDERLAQSFFVLLQKKLARRYPVSIDCELGILVLTERDQLFSESTLEAIKSVLNDAIQDGMISMLEGAFDRLYLGFRRYTGQLQFILLWQR